MCEGVGRMSAAAMRAVSSVASKSPSFMSCREIVEFFSSISRLGKCPDERFCIGFGEMVRSPLPCPLPVGPPPSLGARRPGSEPGRKSGG